MSEPIFVRMSRTLCITFIILFLISLLSLTMVYTEKNRTNVMRHNIQAICSGENLHTCVPPLRGFAQKYRISGRYKLFACAIEKNFSTVLTAILCYLHNETSFVENGRSLLKEGFKYRSCADLNEFGTIRRASSELSKINMKLNPSWGYLAVVRNPLERFVSGFTDKCLREKSWRTYPNRCQGCRKNMTCFMEKLYHRMLMFSAGYGGSPSFDDMHFFPQSWRCEFHTYLRNYTVIQYNTENPGKFLDTFFSYLERYGVPEGSLDFIKSELSGGRTHHATVELDERQIAQKTLTSSPYLMQLLLKMYYYDFVLFGYSLPQLTIV